MIKEEMKIITLGDIFKNIETEEKAFKFLNYIKELQQENQQLKKQKDDEIKYIKEHIKYECDDAFNGMQFYSYHLYDFNKEDLLRMLGEIDVED